MEECHLSLSLDSLYAFHCEMFGASAGNADSNSMPNDGMKGISVGKSDRGCTDNCSKGRGSILTQYLTWFGKTAYIHGRESILFRDREKGLQHIWRRRITSLSPLPALNCYACSCCNGSKAAAIAALFLSTLLHTLTFSLLSFCSHIMPLFIGISWQLFLLVMLSNIAARLGMVGCLTIENGGCQ